VIINNNKNNKNNNHHHHGVVVAVVVVINAGRLENGRFETSTKSRHCKNKVYSKAFILLHLFGG